MFRLKTPICHSVCNTNRQDWSFVDLAYPGFLAKKKIYLVDSLFSEKVEGAPRQKLKNYYLRNGAIYLFKVKSFYKYKSIKGKKCILYEMPKSRSLNLDDSFDLKLLRLLKK